MKKISIYIIFLFSLLFMELLFRIFSVGNLLTINWIYIFFYVSFLSFLFSLLSSILKEKGNKIVFFVLLFLLTIWYCGEIVFKNSFHVYFSLSTTFFADQAISFAGKIFEILFSNFVSIFLVFLPFISSFLFQKKLDFERKNLKKILLFFCSGFICYFLFLGFVLDSNREQYSSYDLYFQRLNNPFNKETFGAFPSVMIELRKLLFPRTSVIYQVVKDESVQEDVPFLFKDNVLEIPFDRIFLQEQNDVLKSKPVS